MFTDGVVLLDEEYVRGRKVFGQMVCTFRYGREEDEVMGLNFYKELFLASEQIYPPPEKRNYELSRTQVSTLYTLFFLKFTSTNIISFKTKVLYVVPNVPLDKCRYSCM